MSEKAPRPYTAGWRAPWRQQWGPIIDGHSRLGRLTNKIERELKEEYHPATPLQRRRVRRAAELMGLAEQSISLLGVDAKITRRSITALQMTAERTLASLRANGNGQATDLARQFRKAIQEGDDAGR